MFSKITGCVEAVPVDGLNHSKAVMNQREVLQKIADHAHQHGKTY